MISNHYGIRTPVEFADVHVDRDNRLFIDPSRIRTAQHSDRYARDAYTLLVSFFDEILRCLRSASPGDQRKGEALLQAFGEPNETRLGMSSVGVRGHGGSDGIGAEIWRELINDPLCRVDVAVLKYIEDVPIFVHGVDADITSDLTTRIIFQVLADFTNAMVAKYSEFTASGHDTKTITYPVWDQTISDWSTARLSLPVAAGKSLLLVPKGWVGPYLLMTYGQYYQQTVLGRVQEERAYYDDRRRRIVRPYKKSLASQPGLGRSRQTCIAQTERVFRDGVDLVEAYRLDADGRAVPLSDEQLAYFLER